MHNLCYNRQFVLQSISNGENPVEYFNMKLETNTRSHNYENVEGGLIGYSKCNISIHSFFEMRNND